MCFSSVGSRSFRPRMMVSLPAIPGDCTDKPRHVLHDGSWTLQILRLCSPGRGNRNRLLLQRHFEDIGVPVAAQCGSADDQCVRPLRPFEVCVVAEQANLGNGVTIEVL